MPDLARRHERLLEASRSTRYAVHDGPGRAPPIIVRIGSSSTRIDAMLRRFGAHSAAIVTSDNPRSERRPLQMNRLAALKLSTAVRRAGFTTLATAAHAESADWPIERGLLIVGITPSRAVHVAEAFGQNAIVMIGRARPASLVCTRWFRPW